MKLKIIRTNCILRQYSFQGAPHVLVKSVVGSCSRCIWHKKIDVCVKIYRWQLNNKLSSLFDCVELVNITSKMNIEIVKDLQFIMI